MVAQSTTNHNLELSYIDTTEEVVGGTYINFLPIENNSLALDTNIKHSEPYIYRI